MTRATLFLLFLVAIFSSCHAQENSTLLIATTAPVTTVTLSLEVTTIPPTTRSSKLVKFRGAQSRTLDEEEPGRDNDAEPPVVAPINFNSARLAQLISKYGIDGPGVAKSTSAVPPTTSEFFFTTDAPTKPTFHSDTQVRFRTFTATTPDFNNEVPVVTTTPATTTTAFTTIAATTILSTTPVATTGATTTTTTTDSPITTTTFPPNVTVSSLVARPTTSSPLTTITVFPINQAEEYVAQTTSTALPSSTPMSSRPIEVIHGTPETGEPVSFSPTDAPFFPTAIKIGTECSNNDFCDVLVPNAFCDKQGTFATGTCQCRPFLDRGNVTDPENACGMRTVCASNPCQGDEDASACIPVPTNTPRDFRDVVTLPNRESRMLNLDVVYQAVFGNWNCRCLEGAKGRDHSSVVPGVCCRPDRFVCADFSGCFSLEDICDGKKQCQDCSDEMHPSCKLSTECDVQAPMAVASGPKPSGGVQVNRGIVSSHSSNGYTTVLGQVLPYRTNAWGFSYGR